MIANKNIKIFFWVIVSAGVILGVTQNLSKISPDQIGPLVISEFVADNQTGLVDEDGDYSDWIEVHNQGNTAINLSGWSLTDDPNDSEKWPFPDIALNGKEYLVVFASGKDRRSLRPGSALHTNFRLNKIGDYLALYNVLDQRVIEVGSPTFPQQFNDFSYGLRRDEPIYNYFATPTPGEPNNTTQTWDDVVSEVKFSTVRGYYESPFRLELTTSTPDAIIRYTTDGSEPTERNGKIYSQPLEINRTILVRAVGFKPNYLPSTANTHSYIFMKDVLTQPVDPAGFPATWGTHREEFKEYVAGSPVIADYEMDPEIVNDPRYRDALKDGLKSIPTMSFVMNIEDFADLYSNPRDRGQAWERPVSVEFINPGVIIEGFQVNAGLRIHGGVGRKEFIPKHSFRLLFKSKYGPATLKYPLFPDSSVEEFNTLVLRGGSDRSFAGTGPIREKTTYTRDEWLRASQLEMSGLGSHGIFVHLYINGLYWGLYNVVEKPDARFMASYFGGDEADWFVANQDGPLNRDSNEWTDRLSELFITIGFRGRQDDSFEQPQEYIADQFEKVEPFIDTTQFSDYIILNWYAGTEDWPQNNWYAGIHDPTGNGKHLVWDGQEIFDDGANITLGKISSARLNIVKPLFEILIQNPDFRMEFADRLYKHLFNDGALTDANALARWREINNTIDWAIIGESARWGDVRYDDSPITRDDWLGAREDVLAQMEGNAAKLIKLAREAGYYPQLDPPMFSRQGGLVTPGFKLTMTASEGEIYYTTEGSDPRVSGTGAVAPTAAIYDSPLTITSNTHIKARTLSAAGSIHSAGQIEWSALNETTFEVVAGVSKLHITEIMYNPPGGSDYEFIELKNGGDSGVDLSNMSFEGIDYTFPTNTVLMPGEIIVLVRNPDTFAERYPEIAIGGVYEGKLANGGEWIILKDINDEVILLVEYDDENGWPLSPDGRGDSLILIDVNRDPNNPKSWRASVHPNGSPGEEEFQ